MRFYNRVSLYDEYGGMGFEEESLKMATALGNKQNLLMANHGILTTGKTVSEGFDELYYFEKSAETYLTALATGKELNVASDEVAEKENEKYGQFVGKEVSELKMELGAPTEDFVNELGNETLVYKTKKYGLPCDRKFEINSSGTIIGFNSSGCF